MSDDSIIHWSKDQKLRWSDFMAEPNPSHEHDALSSIRFFVNPIITADNPDKPRFFSVSKITVIPEFQKKLSWVREFVLGDSIMSKKLLNHEQGHFDLAQEYSDEIGKLATKAFDGKRFPIRGKNEHEILEYAREDALSLANEQVERIKGGFFATLRNLYDSETEFGSNAVKQKEYDARFARLGES
ncbi:hypothetical protein C6988_06460 [Nitrosopumilus sp. b1]|uniref:hypothetical protein n=1 Tax=Nitrosopumilus sp. b1 TaxID=2109907 RepID=UPI0015F4FA4F|nr:hypothetical protein [Nitrosopumilus sp. b1]KAF6242820.1 hypothetical protein C6988_06460 [Nitrosopumilus sp. b1]